MERLTFDGNFCDIAQCREMPCQHGGNCAQKQVWERLKAYEDTGLTPGEVKPMAKYIKLEELMKFPICRNHYDKEHGNEHFIYGIETVLEYAENLPAADVAPVVRCKDCRYFKMYKCRMGYSSHDDFCSYGERKEGAEC